MDKLVGTKQEGDALQGRGVLQSEEEWEVRNHHLAESLSRLMNEHVRFRTGKALDIGCQKGELTDRYAAATALSWRNLERPNSIRSRPGGAPRPFLHRHDAAREESSHGCRILEGAGPGCLSVDGLARRR